MKKKYLVILLLAMLVIPFKVFASGSFNVSSTTITMHPGESKTITITTSDSVGRLNISTSNSGVATVSSGSVFIDTVGAKKTFTIKANSVGSATVSVVGSENYASFSDEVSLKGMIKSIKVNVIEKPVDNRSKNNNLKSISVDGFKLVKVNNNNYALTVSNDVTSINVNALVEDTKAKVSGTGKHELKVGENTITVVITAENGSKNNISIKVTRKDGYYLEDLDSLLSDNNITDIAIMINIDSKIIISDLEKVKNSNKEVKFNYFDENKKLLYSWIVNGSKINDLNEFITTVSFMSENKEEISSLANYADGLYINFSHDGKLPNDTKIKVYVGDKFTNNNLVNIYHYNKDKLELVKSQLNVVDGYVEFDIEHCSEYFITRAILNKNDNVILDVKGSSNLSWILVGVEFVIIIVLLLMKHNHKKTMVENKNKEIVSLNNNIFNENSVYFVENDENSINNEIK